MSNQHLSMQEQEIKLNTQELINFNFLISTLYQCLEKNNSFQPFFDAFQQHFNALNGGILCVTDNPQCINFGWTFGYPDGFEEWFINNSLSERDEAINRFSKLPPRQFESFLKGDNNQSILDFIPVDSPSRAWLKQQGVGDSTGVLIALKNDQKIIFMANRHQSFGAYTQKELFQMNMIAPHLENAVTLRLRLYESHSSNESLAIALNHVNKPLIVFNSMANIAKANDSAVSLIEKTTLFHISNNQCLRSSDERINRQLIDGVATCILQSHKKTPTTHIIFASNAEEKVAVFLTPLLSNNLEDNGVLAELFSYNLDLNADISKLQSLFDCTPAEANIAIELMHGLTAQDIADKKNISIHTVRQQIKSLLAKNGYRKQTELIAMLMRALG